MNLALVGGGNLAHAIAVTASHFFEKIFIVTRNCNGWSDTLDAVMPNESVMVSNKIYCSEDFQPLISNADVILLTLPAHLIPDVLQRMKPYLGKNQMIGSVVASGGFFWIARYILNDSVNLFAFHRVPFISRIIKKGKSVHISGLKKEIFVAFETPGGDISIFQPLLTLFEKSFQCGIIPLRSYLEATISNSNPILHTSRLFSLIKNRNNGNPLYFYKEWDMLSSEMLLRCDNELFEIINKLPVEFPLMKSIRQHYEVADAKALTRKLSSIKAFQTITFPMVKNDDDRYYPDPSNRYFSEDLAFGLVILRALADIVSVPTPAMDTIIRALQHYIGKEFLCDNGKLEGKDIKMSGIPSNFGVLTLEDLLSV